MLGQVKRVRIKGITDLLGSVTSDKEVYSKFIATKAANNEELAIANADAKDLPQTEGKETVFYRDEDGYLI